MSGKKTVSAYYLEGIKEGRALLKVAIADGEDIQKFAADAIASLQNIGAGARGNYAEAIRGEIDFWKHQMKKASVTGKRNPKADPPNVMTFARVPVGAQFRMKNVRNWRGDWSTKISKTEYERGGKTWSPTPSIKCIVRDVEITGSKNPRVKVADAMGNRWRVELTNDKGVHVYIAKGSRKTSWSFTSDQKRAKLFVTRGEAQRYFADYVKPYMDKRFHTPTFEPVNYGPTRAEVLDMKVSGSKNPRFGKPDPLDVRYVVRAKHENGKVYYLTADNKLDSEKSKAEKYPRSKVEAMIRYLELRVPRTIKFVDAVTA